jgi:hypothetical protein
MLHSYIKVLCVNFVYKELFVSKSEAVAKYIPFLRRYARALTGTQSSGDAYVVAALEALIQDPSVLDGPRDPRLPSSQSAPTQPSRVPGQAPAKLPPL